MTIKELNALFDRQIRANPKFASANIVEKKLFNLTIDFTNADWRLIQTAKYFSMQENMTDLEKKRYKLQCVQYYRKHFLNEK